MTIQQPNPILATDPKLNLKGLIYWRSYTHIMDYTTGNNRRIYGDC